MKLNVWLAALIALAPAGSIVAADVDVAAYTRKDEFTDLKMSPDGKYFAAKVPLADRTALVMLERETGKISGSLKLSRGNHVGDFRWVSRDRLIVEVEEKTGSLEQPRPTGELVAIGADGSRAEWLVGYRVDDGGTGTHVKPKKGNNQVWAYLIDSLPVDDRTVLISAQPYSRDPYSTAEQLEVFGGRMTRVATAPVRNARFATDNHGVIRFAWGSNADNVRQLYYRAGSGAQWELMTVESDTSPFEYPVGFSADDEVAYLQAEQSMGPDAIVALELSTRKRTQVLRDDDVDPASIIYRNNTRVPIGAHFIDGLPRTEFFDKDAPEARLYKSLESAFPDEAVAITSQTSDGTLALVQVYSDRNPGDFYLFDTKTKKAAHALATRQWFDPGQQASSRPVRLAARDGLPLHGYLTLPKGSDGRNLPMVVMPHGGPFGIRDVWGFDDDAQVLAAAGYAVLQLNYRGSGGYGRSFKSAGAREWGGKMQDDLTDATLWAVQEGIADRNRICLYGASYGGYASLMGVAKEPSLYRCAAGYVGVYDLPKMQADDRRSLVRWGNWSLDWVGETEKLGAVSPNRMADRIKVPVFLAAGGEDERAPIEHSRMMEQALRRAGVPVETLYYDTEGHGFYKPEHQQEFYSRLLAFLSRSLGGSVAATGGGGDKTAK